MKKTYLFILSALISGFTSLSQVATPCVVDETNSSIGVTPDEGLEFCQDVEVSQVLQAVVPNDTTISIFTFDFETIQLTVDESTVPDGLEFDCANDCIITTNPDGDLSRTCLDLFGTPTTATGTAEVILINAHVTTPQGATFDYPFEVGVTIVPTGTSPCIIDGLEDFEIGSALSVYPNPSKGNAYINLDMPASSTVTIELFDVIGNKIESVYSGILSEGANNIAINKTNELASGMYMLKVDVDSSKGTNTYTERLIVR